MEKDQRPRAVSLTPHSLDDIGANSVEKKRYSSTRSEKTNRYIQKKPSVAVISEIERGEFVEGEVAKETKSSRSDEKPPLDAENPSVHYSVNGDPAHFAQTNIGYGSSSSSIGGRSNQVIREQYWTWSFPSTFGCVNWTRREKILFTVLLIMTAAIIVLVVALFRDEDHRGLGNGGLIGTWTL